MSVNKVILIGRLGADPESRSFQNGNGVVNLRLATSERWKDRNTGERKERTEWHTVAIFSEGLRNIASQYLKKGSQVYLEGKLQTRKWQDQQGNDRYSTEVVLNDLQAKIVLLGDKSETRDDRPGGWDNRGRDGYASGSGGSGGGSDHYDDLDDDIPF